LPSGKKVAHRLVKKRFDLKLNLRRKTRTLQTLNIIYANH
jgi:hypothetical protein